MNTELQKEIARLNERHEKEIASLKRKQRIISMMPSVLGVGEAPSISNDYDEPNRGVHAWVSFSNWNKPSIAVAVAEALEDDGWVLQPMTLAKYGTWRASCLCGIQSEVPATMDRSELAQADPMMPVWLQLNQFTMSEICFFMEKDGLICKFLVDDLVPYRMTAQTTEYRGGWRYKSGSEQLVFRPEKHSLFHNDESFATMYRQFVYRMSETHLEGRITFQLDRDEQSEFNMSLVDIIKAIKG